MKVKLTISLTCDTEIGKHGWRHEARDAVGDGLIRAVYNGVPISLFDLNGNDIGTMTIVREDAP